MTTDISLNKCFETDEDFQKQAKKWFKSFQNVVQRSFKKVRINNKRRRTEVSKLIAKRENLLQNNYEEIGKEQKLRDIEKEIGCYIGSRYL